MSKVHISQRITGFDLLVPSFACTYASFCAFVFLCDCGHAKGKCVNVKFCIADGEVHGKCHPS